MGKEAHNAVFEWAKRNLVALISIPLTLGGLAFFLFKDHGAASIKMFLELRFYWILWIIGAVLAGWVLEALVIHLFCRHLCKNWSFGKSFYIGMVGLFYSALTPFSMGEPVQVYNMTKMGMETGEASAIVAIKTLVHHAVTLVYALFMVLIKIDYFRRIVSNFVLLTVFGLVTNGVFITLVLLFMINEKATDAILLFFIRILKKLRLNKLADKLYGTIQSQLRVFHGSARKIGKAVPLYLSTIALTLVQVTVAGSVAYFVYRSFGLKGESPITMISAEAYVNMASSFIPLPGSTGGAEAGFFLFFREFFGDYILPGLTLWRFALYYSIILFGCVIVLLGRHKYRVPKVPAEDRIIREIPDENA